MRIKIEKGRAVGKITAPPSKSMSHRMLIAAALARGTSVIHGISNCEDVLASIDCLTALGAEFEWQHDMITVRGADFNLSHPDQVLFCRESGSTLRFMIPVSLLTGTEVTFEGAPGLMQRPMTVYEDLFSKKNISYTKSDNQILLNGTMSGGEYELPGNISSQFVSGLLFALPLLETSSTIRLTTQVESRSYIDMTIQALETFGVRVEWTDGQTLQIEGGQIYEPREVTVEGDASGAAFPEALNLFGGSVQVDGLISNSLQGDSVYPRLFNELITGAPTISIADCPDLAPILMTVAAAKNGATFTETARLKIKESDRASVLAQELQKFGMKVSVEKNTVRVEAVKWHAPTAELYGHNDHRIVMALAVLCTLTGGVINGAEAVSKSYPGFWSDLRALGIIATEI